jgi:hypothetical protein
MKKERCDDLIDYLPDDKQARVLVVWLVVLLLACIFIAAAAVWFN